MREVSVEGCVRWSDACDDGTYEIACPECQENYTHILRAGSLVAEGPDADACEAGPYPGTERVGTTHGRRAALEIVFGCECCHHVFAIVIQQHKGHNFLSIDEDPAGKPSLRGEEDDECFYPADEG